MKHRTLFRSIQFIYNEKGKETGVIIPFEDYQSILEDFHDSKKIQSRKKEIMMTSEVFIEKLKKIGKL